MPSRLRGRGAPAVVRLESPKHRGKDQHPDEANEDQPTPTGGPGCRPGLGGLMARRARLMARLHAESIWRRKTLAVLRESRSVPVAEAVGEIGVWIPPGWCLTHECLPFGVAACFVPRLAAATVLGSGDVEMNKRTRRLTTPKRLPAVPRRSSGAGALVVVEVALGSSTTSSGGRPACGPTVTDTPPEDPNAEPDRLPGRVVRASATLNMTMRDLTTRRLVMRERGQQRGASDAPWCAKMRGARRAPYAICPAHRGSSRQRVYGPSPSTARSGTVTTTSTTTSEPTRLSRRRPSPAEGRRDDSGPGPR